MSALIVAMPALLKIINIHGTIVSQNGQEDIHDLIFTKLMTRLLLKFHESYKKFSIMFSLMSQNS